MKMTYLLKNSNLEMRKKNSQRRILVTIIVLIIIMLLLLTNPARKILFAVGRPVWKVENSIFNSNLFKYFKSKQALIDEKIATEQKLFLAGNLLALNGVLQNENDELKSLLGRAETKQKTILATVLVKPPQIPYDSLIIDLGADFGLKEGNKVVVNGNIYLGEVSEVFPHLAKIILYSSPGRKLPVVLGTNSVSVEAIGIGGGNFNIFLPREIEVRENDVVVVPAITANVFGIVEKVNFQEKDSFQTVLFKSPVNISELNFVEVVIQ